MRKGYILEEYVILKCCAEAKADLGLFTGRIVVRLSLAAVAAGIRTKAQGIKSPNRNSNFFKPNKLKQEAEKCLQQSERFNNEKADFEQASFSKVQFLVSTYSMVSFLVMMICNGVSYGNHVTVSL